MKKKKKKKIKNFFLGKYELTLENPLGPFTNKTDEEERDLFDKLSVFSVDFQFQSIDNSMISFVPQGRCIQWNLHVSIKIL